MDDLETISACSKLIDVIKKNKQLSEQLGIDFLGETSRKRSAPLSPLRLKKVRIDPSVASSSSSHTLSRSPDENALDSETSNVGAGLEETFSTEACDSDQNPNDLLEELLSKEDTDPSESEKDDDSSDDDEDLLVLGDDPEANWTPSKKLYNWYLKVADIELPKDILSGITEEFKSDKEVNEHFSPPKFPLPLWTAVQSSSADAFKLKSIYKAQENLFLSIKPLLEVAKNCPKEERAPILKSIQLICNSNLSLNRLRRCMLAPHLKADLRKSLLAIPVKHNSLFGDDFNKVTDGLIKENSAIDKILVKKTQKPSNFQKGKNNSNWSSKNDNSNKQPFRGPYRGKGSFRGRGKGKSPYYPPNNNNNNNANNNKSDPPAQKSSAPNSSTSQ